jgi:hypothetical protein
MAKPKGVELASAYISLSVNVSNQQQWKRIEATASSGGGGTVVELQRAGRQFE